MTNEKDTTGSTPPNVVVKVPSVPREVESGEKDSASSFFLSEATFTEDDTLPEEHGPDNNPIPSPEPGSLAPSQVDAISTSFSASRESLVTITEEGHHSSGDTTHDISLSSALPTTGPTPVMGSVSKNSFRSAGLRPTESQATIFSEMSQASGESKQNAGSGGGKRRRVRQFTVGGSSPFARGGDTQQRRLYRSILQKPENARSRQDLRMINSLVKNMEVFQGLPDDTIMQLCRCVSHDFAKRRTTVCRIGEKATKLYVLLVGNVVLAEPVGGNEPSGRSRRLAPPLPGGSGLNSTGLAGGADASDTGSVHDGASSAALSRNTSRSDMTLNRTPSSVALDGREPHSEPGQQGHQRSPRGGQEKVPITVDPAIQTMLNNTNLVPVAMLGVGDNIGAFNLLRGAPLSQTAVVAEDTEFLTLSKRDYDRTLRARAEKLLQEKVDFVSNLPAFARSTRGYVTQFAHALVAKTAPRNTVLVQQNAPVEMIYFVKSGDCRLTMTVEHTKEHKFPLQHTTRESTTLDVATVGPGELIGASECLQGLPYSGTVIASTTIEYLEITRNEFVQKMGQETRLEVIRATEPKMARRLERCQQLLDLAEKKVIQPLRTTFLGERLTYPMELMRKDTSTFCITPRLSKQIHASFQASPHTSLRERAEARIHGKAVAERGPQHRMPGALTAIAPLPSTAGSQVGSVTGPASTPAPTPGPGTTAAAAAGKHKAQPHPPSSTHPPPSAQSPRAGMVSVAASPAMLASKHSEPTSGSRKHSVTFVTGTGLERSLPVHNKITGRVSFGHRRADTLDSMAFDSDDSDDEGERRGDGTGGVDWEGPRTGGAWDFAPHFTVARSVPKASRSYRSIRAEKANARLVSRRQAAQESANARNLARTRITKVLLADALSRTGNFRIRDHMSPDTEGVILQPGAARIGRRKAGSTNAATLAEYEALFAKPKAKTGRLADGTVRLTALKRIETEKLLSPRN